MKNGCAFSVVMPVYNKEAYVARAIETVLNQAFSSFELIIINDASTDDSIKKIMTFNDSRIRVLQRTSPGPGGYAARNLGIREAKNDWIAFLDADDIWYPNHLQTICNNIDNGIDVICCGFAYDTGRIIKYKESKIFCNYEALDLLENENFICTNSIAARKNKLLEVGMFPTGKCKRGGDSDLWLRLLLNAEKTVVSTVVTSLYYTAASDVISNKKNIYGDHPIYQTAQNVLLRENLSVEVQDKIKKIANRKNLSWALESKAAGLMKMKRYKRFYFSAFTKKDWKKYLALMLPHKVFIRLLKN